MPLDDVLDELRELPGKVIPPPDPAGVLPHTVARVQAKLLADLPADVNAALLTVATTREGGGNAAFVVRTPSGWDVKLWIGTESWENPQLDWGVTVEKTWTW